MPDDWLCSSLKILHRLGVGGIRKRKTGNVSLPQAERAGSNLPVRTDGVIKKIKSGTITSLSVGNRFDFVPVNQRETQILILLNVMKHAVHIWMAQDHLDICISPSSH